MDIINGLATLLGLNKSPAQTGVPAGKAGNGVLNIPQGQAKPLPAIPTQPIQGEGLDGILQTLSKFQPLPRITNFSPKLPMQAAEGGQIPVGQSLSNQDISKLSPQIQGLAQIYNQNPQDPRVAHLDPAIFGYAPDNTVRSPQQTPFNSAQQRGYILPQGQSQSPQPSQYGIPAGIAGNGLINLPQQTPLHSLLNRY